MQIFITREISEPKSLVELNGFTVCEQALQCANKGTKVFFVQSEVGSNVSMYFLRDAVFEHFVQTKFYTVYTPCCKRDVLASMRNKCVIVLCCSMCLYMTLKWFFFSCLCKYMTLKCFFLCVINN